VAAKLKGRLDKSQEALDRLPLLDDPQVAFLLLRSCAGFCRIVYLARALSCKKMEATAAAFDKATIGTLGSIIGVPLGEEAVLQSQQPMFVGGLGLRSAEAHLGAAHLASVNANRGTTGLVLAATQSTLPPHSLALEPLEQLAKALRTDADQIDVEIAISSTQSKISEVVDAHEGRKLVDLLSLRDRARLQACHGPFGALVLTAAPAAALGTRLTPHEFRFFVAHRLGLRVLFEEGQPCPLCNSPSDAEGFHALTCHTGGTLTRRHNAIRNIIFHACRKAAWNPALEVAVTGGGKALVPADVYVPKNIAGDQALAVDITVVHPLQQATVALASKVRGTGARYAEARKTSKHGAACAASGLTFIPVAIEVFGHIGEEGEKFLTTLAKAVATRLGLPTSVAFKDLTRRIAFSLLRSQADAVLTRADPYWGTPEGGSRRRRVVN
jgi:hypothetical protein